MLQGEVDVVADLLRRGLHGLSSSALQHAINHGLKDIANLLRQHTSATPISNTLADSAEDVA